jgi:hypothetical protein
MDMHIYDYYIYLKNTLRQDFVSTLYKGFLSTVLPHKNINISKQGGNMSSSQNATFWESPTNGYRDKKMTCAIKHLLYSILMRICKKTGCRLFSRDYLKFCGLPSRVGGAQERDSSSVQAPGAAERSSPATGALYTGCTVQDSTQVLQNRALHRFYRIGLYTGITVKKRLYTCSIVQDSNPCCTVQDSTQAVQTETLHKLYSRGRYPCCTV